MRLLPVLAISIASLTLVGCSTTTPQAIPTSSAVEQAPAFSSDEEALAAAQAAYSEYLSVSDQIAGDGGANPERLEQVVDKELLPSELSTLSLFADHGIHLQGQSNFDSAHLQGITANEVSMYLCLDTSNAQLLDAQGEVKSVSQTRFPMVVTFNVFKNNQMKLSGSQSWSGTNFC